MSAAGLIPWAIEALIASTVLMVAVLCLRGVVRRSFGPDIAYALWALPALRMLLPPLPQSWREIAVAPVVRASEQITIYVLEPLGGDVAATAVQHPSLGPILVSLWVVGAAAFIGWHSFVHARFCRRMLDQTAREARIEGGVRLIETSAASGPLAFGIWRRYVAFPRDFSERYDADERNLALAHELAAEQPVHQPPRFALDIIVAGNERPIEIAAPIFLMPDDILGQQPAEQSLDRIGRPVAPGRDPLGDIGGAERGFVPKHFHHGMFGIADSFGHNMLP